jgi:hypothetical protein
MALKKPTESQKLMDKPFSELLFMLPAERVRVIERMVDRYRKDPNYQPNLKNDIEREVFRRMLLFADG